MRNHQQSQISMLVCVAVHVPHGKPYTRPMFWSVPTFLLLLYDIINDASTGSLTPSTLTGRLLLSRKGKMLPRSEEADKVDLKSKFVLE
jgi:hypothetical protein